MKTVSIPLASVKGPSVEMVILLLDTIQDSVGEHSDIFEYSIDDALLRIHEDIDDTIQVISGTFPEALSIEYILVFNGTNCDFLPGNDFTDDVAQIMKDMLTQP